MNVDVGSTDYTGLKDTIRQNPQSFVCPPVVAVHGGATIIQPSVVKTESDVMRTVKQPLLTADGFRKSTCHAEAEPSHTHTRRGLLCYWSMAQPTQSRGAPLNYMLL